MDAETVWKPSFPQSRVKSIMKLDPDVQNVSADAVYAVTVATQLFVELLVLEAHQYTLQSGRYFIYQLINFR